jgi:hypothetical protein
MMIDGIVFQVAQHDLQSLHVFRLHSRVNWRLAVKVKEEWDLIPIDLEFRYFGLSLLEDAQEQHLLVQDSMKRRLELRK